MFICIDKRATGTKKHLVYCTDTSGLSWSDEIPLNAWVFSSERASSIKEALRISGDDIKEIFPDRFAVSFSELQIDTKDLLIPMHMCMPTHVFKSSIQEFLRRSQSALESLESTGYIQTLMANQKVLLALTRSIVDENKIKRYIQESSSGPSVVSALKSFIPEKDGFCKLAKYSLSKTVTGRMIVDTGPSILTLSSKYRDILKSRYQDGKIVQVDFVSLEPRVCRFVAGGTAKSDIYNDVANFIFSGEQERKTVKLAVLCAIYGVSIKRLANLLGSESESRRIVREVRKYFSVAELERNLKGQLLTHKKISNYFGRPLQTDAFESHVLVSHFIQSTSVDVAMSGFEVIISKTRTKNIKPLFLIHDAIIFDVDAEGFEYIKNVAEQGIDLDMGHFPTSLEIISSQDNI